MTAQELISNLQVKGVRFERTGDDSFTVTTPPGVVTAEDKELLTEHKPEILSYLTRTESKIKARFFKGLDCPQCRKPVEVITHPLDDEVWLHCTDPDCLIKTLHHDKGEWCRDCGQKLNVIAGRCAECLKRVLLAPNDPCQQCNSGRYWRQAAGALWSCARCNEPWGKAIFYEVTQ